MRAWVGRTVLLLRVWVCVRAPGRRGRVSPSRPGARSASGARLRGGRSVPPALPRSLRPLPPALSLRPFALTNRRLVRPGQHRLHVRRLLALVLGLLGRPDPLEGDVLVRLDGDRVGRRLGGRVAEAGPGPAGFRGLHGGEVRVERAHSRCVRAWAGAGGERTAGTFSLFARRRRRRREQEGKKKRRRPSIDARRRRPPPPPLLLQNSPCTPCAPPWTPGSWSSP